MTDQSTNQKPEFTRAEGLFLACAGAGVLLFVGFVFAGIYKFLYWLTTAGPELTHEQMQHKIMVMSVITFITLGTTTFLIWKTRKLNTKVSEYAKLAYQSNQENINNTEDLRTIKKAIAWLTTNSGESIVTFDEIVSDMHEQQQQVSRLTTLPPLPDVLVPDAPEVEDEQLGDDFDDDLTGQEAVETETLSQPIIVRKP